jgi:hypothetical protein
MNEYEIVLTGESRDDALARAKALSGIEPGVYGKRWNPDGSLTIMVRSEQSRDVLMAALDEAEHPKARFSHRHVSTESAESADSADLNEMVN